MTSLTLTRYVLRNHIGPYLFGLAVITFIFIMDFIFRYLDLFIDKGVDFLVVLEFFVLSLGHMFALIIPMAVMPATLMAFGQLASDNEITAMKASGISLYQIITPVLIAATLLSAGLLYFHDRILPESNHRLMNLMIDIGKMKPTLEIKENIFSDALPGYTILIHDKNDKTGDIEDVQIFERKSGGIPTSIIAERGKIAFRREENVIQFQLENGEIHEMPDPKDVTTYRKTHFNHYTLNIRDVERNLRRSKRSYRGDREMSADMMRGKIRELENEVAGIEDHMHLSASGLIAEVFSPVFPGMEGLAANERAGRKRSGPQQAIKGPVKSAVQMLKVLENEANIIQSKENQINRYGVEIQKKYSIPFSCIVFVLIGAPLAIRSGKKGMTISIGLSILFFLIYYIFLISGEKLADRHLAPPFLAMWMPNILLFSMAVILIHRTVRETQTINWERLNLLKRWRRPS